MTSEALLGLSVLMNLIAFGTVTKLYIWPRLQALPRAEALLALTVPHMFRFVGLSFLIPGVVAPSLPSEFAVPTAYGDLVASLLAIIAAAALSMRASWAVGMVWAFNLWGTIDLLKAISTGIVPGDLGAAFYIPTMIVPPLLVTHGLIFWLLLRR